MALNVGIWLVQLRGGNSVNIEDDMRSLLDQVLENPTQLISRLLRIPRLLLSLKIHPRATKPISKPSSPLPIIRKSPRKITPHIHTLTNRLRHSTNIPLKEPLTEHIVKRCGAGSPVVLAFCGGSVFGYVDGGVVAGPDPMEEGVEAGGVAAEPRRGGFGAAGVAVDVGVVGDDVAFVVVYVGWGVAMLDVEGRVA